MRILTAKEMKQAEDTAVANGSSYEQLMENAGTAAAAAIVQKTHENNLPRTALLLCGKGNNAGDAFVIGRLLAQQGWQVAWIPLLGNQFSPLAQLNIHRLPSAVQLLTDETVDFSQSVIIDGIFGTGFSGELPPAVSTACRISNTKQALRIALDLSSGLNCDTGDTAQDTFCAHITLTFGAYKPGLFLPQNKIYCGDIQCLDIGL